MKHLFKFLMITALILASCEDDSGDVVFNITNNTETGGGNGNGDATMVTIGNGPDTPVTSDLTLDGPGNNEIYVLSSSLVMASGTTLTITAGTEIRSSAGTAGYIAIQQGATIDAKGTATNPIVMTSNSSNPSPGDWGGLVILGNASINSGDIATSEVGNFSYGGNDDSDNSGTLEYIRLEYTGAAINSDAEYNGISLYGVGSGTTVRFIEVHQGADDGLEFFGGTVEASNIIVTASGDDSIDWTEGWRGSLTDVYIQLFEGISEKAVEADGNEDDNTLTPLSNPTINNMTVIGPGSTRLNDDGELFEAIRLRRGTQATFNNLYIQGVADGFDVDDPTTVDHITNDDTNVINVTFSGVPTLLKSQDNSAGMAATEDQLFSGVGMGTQTNVALWGAGWSTEPVVPETVMISGDQNTDLNLDGPGNNAIYVLTAPLNMKDGTTLTITPGTTIRSSAGTDGYIAIEQGAMINAVGTASNPIVMTSNSDNPSAGDWGGLLIFGRATINSGVSATSEVANLPYGGSDDADNSGTLQYIRMEYTGAAINSDAEYNGISLYGVGSGTSISFIQVDQGADDGLEFFGGTVEANNIVVTASGDDSIDWTEGWRGTLTDTYIRLIEGVSEKGIEADGNEDDNTATPLSNPTINSMTIIGPGSGALNDDGEPFEAIRLRRGTQATFNNLFIQGVADGFDVDDPTTVDHITGDLTNVNIVSFADVLTNLKSDDNSGGTAATEADLFTNVGSATQTNVSSWGAGWTVGIN